MSKHLARATQEPGVVREIDDGELLDLARQGILHSFKHTPETKAVLEGTRYQVVEKWKTVKDSDDIVTAPPGTTDPAAPAVDDEDDESADADRKGE